MSKIRTEQVRVSQCISYPTLFLINDFLYRGFLSLAQFPFVFLYAAKSSPVTLLLGRGYEKLNFLHRWAGRMLMLTAIIHGSLWIRFRLVNNEKDLLLHGSKELRGQASLGLIIIIVLTSLRPIRRLAYNYFFAFQ